LLIESEGWDGGADVNLEVELNKGNISKFFPVHHQAAKSQLINTWGKKFWRSQPIHAVRDYFGENVAIYFAFLGFYAQSLFVASILGIIAFIVG
jgi:hypothetical protein